MSTSPVPSPTDDPLLDVDIPLPGLPFKLKLLAVPAVFGLLVR